MRLIAERFEIGEFIAQGGMGAVYRGLDRQTGQMVAIKSVRPELVDVALIARFQQEGETLRTLNHPNIVKLVMAVQDGDQHYLIMEYVNGGSLADLLAKQSSLPADQTVSIALELADALARAHHLKVIHRDLKPANVLLAEDGTPRLTDFGVARTAQGNLTGTGVIVGTLSYLAPEILNGQLADARADIWAFGVTLFELLTGRLPFRADSPAALITAILTQPTPDLESLRPELPVALVDLIYRMLDKDPRQRIGSMRMIAAELEALYRAEPDTERMARSRSSNGLVESSIIALPTPTPARDNLPVQTTPFVGREAELAELAKMIADPATRLITILGPGGMGKTRLALEAASAQLRAFADGAYFVSLAPISDPESIIAETANAVGFQFYQGEITPRQQLLSFFREKSMLVVFDNFEHVLAGVGFIADILSTARNIKILITSRERLTLDGETLFRLEGMDFPNWETPEGAAEYSAVKLFLISAKRVLPSFALTAKHLQYLARICRQVQGMPLGILLAAAWVDNLSLKEISEEIAHNIDFLESEARNTPTRQRSIRATFDYSWNLLSADEQSVFMKISVFRGGFGREAVQAVTGASLKTLASLVNKSLLRRDPDGRYDIHELLRQYADNKLQENPGALEATRDRHCQYYTDFAYAREDRLFSRDQLMVIPELDLEFANVRLAVEWAIEHNDAKALRQCLYCLPATLMLRSQSPELVPYFRRAFANCLSVANAEAHPITGLVGWMFAELSRQAGFESYRETFSLCLPILRIHNFHSEMAYSLNYLSMSAPTMDEAKSLRMDSINLYRSLGPIRSIDKWGLASSLAQGAYDQFTSEPEQEAMFGEAQTIFESLGERVGLSFLYQIFGVRAVEKKDQVEGRRYSLMAMRLTEELGRDGQIIESKGNWAFHEWQSGNDSEVEKLESDVLRIAKNIGRLDKVVNAMYWLIGDAAYRQTRYEDSYIWFRKGVRLSREIGDPRGIVRELTDLSYPAIALGKFVEAEVYLREALKLSATTKDMENPDLIQVEILMLLTKILAEKNGMNNQQRAVEYLALTNSHPAWRYDFDAFSNPLWAQLEAELPPDEFAAAVERGKALDLDIVVAELLAEPPLFLSNAPDGVDHLQA